MTDHQRDYTNGCPVCGRTDVVAEKTYKGERLIVGHACEPPFAPELPELVARCECSPRGLEPVVTEDGLCRRCGVEVVYVPPETPESILQEHGR